MKYRRFGRLRWDVSEVGVGTWGMGAGPSGWQGGTREESLAALKRARELGCNFFDTAWIYGRGESERLLGEIATQARGQRLYLATKIPPKNLTWPSRRGDRIEEIFPRQHVMHYVEASLANLGVEQIDLLQFHVWEDDWYKEDEWQRAVEDLKRRGMVRGIGISVNTWEPTNVLRTLDTGLIDAVQVVYNLFEQQPEDVLFPYCLREDIAIIARVPFDEGSLTGAITLSTCFDDSDWRASYFVRENLEQCVPRVERLRRALDGTVSLPEFALRFILHHPAVSTVIPGMRRRHHVERNVAASDSPPLPEKLLELARLHRWNRTPTTWSQ